MHLPDTLYTAAQSRELDRRATDGTGVDGYTLMTRAGAAACRVLRLRWPSPTRVAVVCGTGNNGGDGFVIARLLREAGVEASVFVLGDVERIAAEAAIALADWQAAGGGISAAADARLEDYDLCVDALFGTGLTRQVEAGAAELVRAMNDASCPVLAIDVPSGINSDTGAVEGVAVQAELTITFIALKPGLFTHQGAAHAGLVCYADLAVPSAILKSVEPAAVRVSARPSHPAFDPAPADAYKNYFGHLLVIGGDHGMAGAIRLCGMAALRTGAGLVSVATRESHARNVAAQHAELMVHAVESTQQLGSLAERAAVIVVGPGLGTGTWGRKMLAAALQSGKPLVIDADALNLLAGLRQPCPQAILTPHPGEAARLLDCTAAEVQHDRFAACRRLHEIYGAVILLKGNGSLVSDGVSMSVVDRGTPALATAGSGDVLSGVLGALRLREHTAGQSAVAGCWLHAVAAEAVAGSRQRGMLSGDLLAALASSASL